MRMFVLAIAALFAASPAFAANEFETVDVDASGTISFEEAASALNVEREAYDAADLDQDGELNAEEYTAMLAMVTQ